MLARGRPLIAFTAVEIAGPWILRAAAERRLPSSLSGLLVAAVPLVGATMAWAVGGHEPMAVRGVTGLLVGLTGVAVLVGFDVSGAQVGPVLMVAGVVVGYATGPII